VEVRNIINSGYARATNILETHRDALERVAQALLEREVLDATELKLLMEGKPLPEKPPPPPPTAPPVTAREPQLTLRPEPRPIPGLAKGEKPAPA
jgi:cell division protease FtsH